MDLVSCLMSYEAFELEVSAATERRVERDTLFFLDKRTLQSEFSDEVWFDTWNDLETTGRDLDAEVRLARDLKRCEG